MGRANDQPHQDQEPGQQVATAPRESPEASNIDTLKGDYDRTSASLMGWSEDRLVAELGEPATIRQEAPARVWQYRGPACVFDVVLYEEGEAFRVAYFEARDLEARRQPAELCLPSIRAAHSQS